MLYLGHLVSVFMYLKNLNLLWIFLYYSSRKTFFVNGTINWSHMNAHTFKICRSTYLLISESRLNKRMVFLRRGHKFETMVSQKRCFLAFDSSFNLWPSPKIPFPIGCVKKFMNNSQFSTVYREHHLVGKNRQYGRNIECCGLVNIPVIYRLTKRLTSLLTYRSIL